MRKFENAKIGDKVWSCLRGWGRITDIDNKDDGIYAMEILFQNNITRWYALDGYCSTDHKYPELFWNEYKIPTTVEDKKPFDLEEFLKENLEPKEFEYGLTNDFIIYYYDYETFDSFISDTQQNIGTIYFKDVPDYVIRTLNENKITPSQLNEAFKTLGWI